jgi:glycosyltransferase involved in cell wall biosynthesis
MRRNDVIRVGVFQRSVPEYRVPILDELAMLSDLDVTVYATGFAAPLRHAKAVRIREVAFGRVRFHPAVVSSTTRAGLDVIVCEGGLSLAASVMSALMSSTSRVGVVWWTSLWTRSGRVEVGRGLRGLLARAVIHRCAAVAAYSRSAAAAAIDAGVPRERVFLASNALDTRRLRLTEAELGDRAALSKAYRARLGIGDGPIALFVGRLIREKRLADLLTAFEIVMGRAMDPPPHLLIVGDGPERRRLERSVSRRGIGTHVSIMGEIRDDRALLPMLLMARALALPGTGGLAVNQAMACGLPAVVAGGDGTERDMIVDGRSGYLVPPASPGQLASRLAELLYAPDERWQAMSRSARDTVTAWANSETMVAGLASAIRKAAEVRPVHGRRERASRQRKDGNNSGRAN